MYPEIDGEISNGMQKRFLVFGGECYYAAGGFNDFIEGFDLALDAVVHCEKTQNGDEWDDRWYQVFDSKTNQVIWSSENEPYGAHRKTNNQHDIRICVSCLWLQAACNSYYCVSCETEGTTEIVGNNDA